MREKTIHCRTLQLVASCGEKKLLILLYIHIVFRLLRQRGLWGKEKASSSAYLQQVTEDTVSRNLRIYACRSILSKMMIPSACLPRHSDQQFTKRQWQLWYRDIQLRLWIALFYEAWGNDEAPSLSTVTCLWAGVILLQWSGINVLSNYMVAVKWRLMCPLKRVLMKFSHGFTSSWSFCDLPPRETRKRNFKRNSINAIFHFSPPAKLRWFTVQGSEAYGLIRRQTINTF